ncbi:MAG: hypothetical protein CFH21_00578 [Alphaproteobacteria bacterium MarineAlpha5_Bin11]|nr:hypothetical protein [Pelagibacteraceae bacterium]PPR43978.1 MAG: hypothetical protein CFH21_00578 [Alphaproteobacteria bacterium MarineAlpha5_Bin11]PPR51271.1 MAG: hypothetical protein CFH20_00697 [Alphaproteobacteria bacterium MarineAlpha5_Bin10]|tara:strand:+ start:15121 stop:15984 length:864 start_codon:yes stop_codon:yes gene_type:complete
MNYNNKYISTTVFPDNTPILFSLKKLKELGFNKIELGSTHPYEDNILEKLKKTDFDFLVHNFFPTPKDSSQIINISSSDKKIRTNSIKHIIDRINFSKNIDSKLYTFHAGYLSHPLSKNANNKNWDFVYNSSKNSKISYEEAFNNMIDSVKKFITVSERLKQPIALESCGSYNNKDMLLMQKLPEFERLFKEIDSKYLGLNINLGHLNLASHAFNFNKFEFIEGIKDKIFAFEISHNNKLEDEHKLLEQDEWYFKIIKDNKFRDIPMIFEGRNTPLVNIKTLWEFQQ